MENKHPESENAFYVELFGTFQMYGFGKVLHEEDMHSKMLIKLMAFLFTHRRKEVSVIELIDALWSDEDATNPAGALKNLVFRLRSLLASCWPDHDFILSKRGYYIWNTDIAITSDAIQFEEYFRLAKEAVEINDKIQFYQQALALYKGPFLSRIHDEQWVVPKLAHFHSLYLSLVKELADAFFISGQYEEMESLCNDALQVDPLNEDIHISFIKALLYQNKLQLAETHYNKAIALIYDSLGVPPSEELKKLYQTFLAENKTLQNDLASIEAELFDASYEGAFLCDFGLFKRNFHLDRARANRFGISMFLILVTLSPHFNLAPQSDAYIRTIKEGMAFLEESLLTKLRAGDVISRYSPNQLLMLLPSAQYETAMVVTQRVEEAFNSHYKHTPRANLSFELKEVK